MYYIHSLSGATCATVLPIQLLRYFPCARFCPLVFRAWPAATLRVVLVELLLRNYYPETTIHCGTKEVQTKQDIYIQELEQLRPLTLLSQGLAHWRGLESGVTRHEQQSLFIRHTLNHLSPAATII